MTDIVEKVKFDRAQDKVIVERVQDVDPYLKDIKQKKENYKGAIDGVGHYVGTIPGIIIERYLKECGVSYEEFCKDDTHVKRILQDPDYKRFRVWEGNW
jgi:hypothetical protein